MQKEEIQSVKALYVVMAGYYGQKLEDSVLAMFADDLADLPFESVATALKEVRRDPKTTRCPLPAVIRAKIIPVIEDADEGRAASARIVSAVRVYGWNNPESAKNFIGPLGWEVVQLQGGWVQVCEMLTTENLMALQAQWRDLATSTNKVSKVREFHERLQLDSKSTKSLEDLGIKDWAKMP